VRRRGQGTIELALGLTLLVPVLMIGWSFAEASMLGLKVHEASESALWDSTARPSMGGLMAARADALQRYADFDGRLSRPGSGPRASVASQSGTLSIDCRGVAMTMPNPTLLDPVLPAAVGASCSARATATLFGSGTVLGVPWAGLTVDRCSAGRPDGVGGACRGEVALALNDGALQNHSNCDVMPDGTACENEEYFRKVKRLYDDTGGPQGSESLELVTQVLNGGRLGLPQGAETSLDTYLSSWGEDAPAMPFAQENRHRADGDERRWFTTPFAQYPSAAAAWGAREDCYLGMYCDSPSIDRP